VLTIPGTSFWLEELKEEEEQLKGCEEEEEDEGQGDERKSWLVKKEEDWKERGK
jgi:hypothetical protein